MTDLQCLDCEHTFDPGEDYYFDGEVHVGHVSDLVLECPECGGVDLLEV